MKVLIVLLAVIASAAVAVTAVTLPAIADNAEDKGKGKESDKVEIKAHVGSESTHVRVEIRFTTQARDRQGIAGELNERIRLDRDAIAGVLKVEHEKEHEEEKLEARAKVTPANTFVKFEYEFLTNARDRDAIVDVVASRLNS
ncbi:MAG: hypothetical protein RMI32_05085 [Candidatus Nitrosocaldus sp.]|nr:hypothetical protein [Candidatus Nitrosocaldus sp.]